MARKKPLWYPVKGEPTKQWLWFLEYLHMERRSLAKLARILQIHISTVQKASSQWAWRSRTEEYDNDINNRMAGAVDRHADHAVRLMKKRHIKLGLGMQAAAAKELKAWVAKIEDADEEAKRFAIEEGKDPDKAFHEPILKIHSLIQLVEKGTYLERLNLGEPTDVTESRESDTGLENLTVDELRAMRLLQRKMRGETT